MEVLVWGPSESLARAVVPSILETQAYKVLGPALLCHLLEEASGLPPKTLIFFLPTYHCVSLEHVSHLLANLLGATLDEYLALCNSHNCVESVRAPGSSRVSLQGMSTIGMIHRVLWNLGCCWDLLVSFQSSRSLLVLSLPPLSWLSIFVHPLLDSFWPSYLSL